MLKTTKVTCQMCSGKKIIPGRCECNMEWRGSNTTDMMDDCLCSADETCLSCAGKGYVLQPRV